MIFKLIIDREKEEQIVATVHQRSPLTDEIETLVAGTERRDELTGYTEEDTVILKIPLIECICVEDGKTFAIYADGVRYRLRGRLYELEERLDPTQFVRISNSEIIRLQRAKSFDLSLAGTICVRLSDGSTSYVSRRYMSRIKQLLGI